MLSFALAAAITVAGCQTELDERCLRNGDANISQVESQNQKAEISQEWNDDKHTVLRVNIPDHAKQRNKLVTLIGQKIAFVEFVPRFRSLVESRQFSLIEVYWGKVGSNELEKIVNDIADSANVRIEKWVFSSSGVELWPREGWSPKVSP